MSNRTPVVWLVNEGGHDYTSAERLGRLMPITTGSINPFNTDRLMLLASHRLSTAIEDDFLVISGSPLLNALIVAMWLKRFGKVNALLWSHRDEEYKLVTVLDSVVTKHALGEQKVAP